MNPNCTSCGGSGEQPATYARYGKTRPCSRCNPKEYKGYRKHIIEDMRIDKAAKKEEIA